jgi:hypothetical protein
MLSGIVRWGKGKLQNSRSSYMILVMITDVQTYLVHLIFIFTLFYFHKPQEDLNLLFTEECY